MEVDSEVVVIGAGVVGLSIARHLALRGHDVLLLEREAAFGTQTSSRNSEVVHAGLYYPAGSLKARCCVTGKARLYDYCRTRAIPHRRCGKLIVATAEPERALLDRIAARAEVNGVHDLERLDATAVAAMEPAITCLAALHSPSTGIVDSHALMLSLLGEAESAGAMLATHASVQAVRRRPDGAWLLSVNDADEPESSATELSAWHVVNAAGHGACTVASLVPNRAAAPIARWAKGNYFRLAAPSPVQRLVYPVPEPGGLGVHATIDLAGQARFGPDVQWLDEPDLAVDASRADAFYAGIRRYWPALPDDALVPDYAGLRPKIERNGRPIEDFLIEGEGEHGVAGWTDLFGIESPGLTAALALAAEVGERVRTR